MPKQTTPSSQQRQLRSLLERTNTTQTRAAELIAQHTERPCSVRSVRAWLADDSLPSARPCPLWAVHALEEELKKANLL